MSRVLSIVLGAVLLANAVLGLYLLLREPEAQTTEVALTAPELGRELALLRPGALQPQRAETEAAASPDRIDGEARDSGEGGPELNAGMQNGLDTAAQQSPAAVRCVFWGPFPNETAARNQLAELRVAGAVADSSSARVEGTTVQRDPDFMIFVGPFPSLGAARTVRDELKALGSDADVVTREERLVVSTGVFSRRRFAASQTAKLKEWGYEPKQTELIRSERIYFLLADIAGGTLADIDHDKAVARAQGSDDGADDEGSEIPPPMRAQLRPAGTCDVIASQYGIL